MTAAPLYMMQIQPDAFRIAAWMKQQGVARAGIDDGYGWHALLTAAFGENAPKPFRVVEPAVARAGSPTKPLFVLGYSSTPLSTLMQYAQTFAEPAVVSALRLDADGVSEKLMPSRFTPGQRFGFEVFVRPTVRQDRDGNRKASREKDAFLAALDKLPPRGERHDLDRDTVYRDWLAQRLAPAAQLDLARTQIAARDRALLLRRGHQDGDRSERRLHEVGRLRQTSGQGGGGPTAVFVGALTISDPVAFSTLLARGVGRHRSFGFGMLLLKPPQ